MSKFIVLVEDVDPRTLAGEPYDVVSTVMTVETEDRHEAMRIYNFMTGTSGYRVTMKEARYVIEEDILHWRKHNDDRSDFNPKYQ